VTERVASVPVVGTVLPSGTIVYHDVPREYLAPPATYTYAVVNDRIVLVEPGTRRVVQIIERR
jgi:hypothetical protein